MTSPVVIDSGVFLATVFEEGDRSVKAESLFQQWKQQDIELVAPTLFGYEVVAVVRRNLYQQKISDQEAAAALSKVLNVRIRYFLKKTLLRRSFELATQFNQKHAYDSQYLAVAERLGCEFWTADERLYNAVKDHLAWVNWLGNFTPPTVS